MFIIFLILLLPLIEIWGFVVIGGHIGAALSLLWVMGAGFYGVRLLTTRRGPSSPFDELCVIVAALLLIFPGFISDFIALPLLWAPVRRILAALIWQKHQQSLKDLDQRFRRFTYWQREETRPGAAEGTIEGNFKRLDDEDKRIT